MKPRSAGYHRAEDVESAVALLAQHGPDARVLAGGQSLVPMLNLRTLAPSALVDVNALDELDYVRVEDGHLAVGALTRTRTIERDPVVAERLALLREAAARVGHPAVRNQGTVGGNLANADPLADLPPVLVALDGEVVARSAGGERTIAAAELFRGPGETALEPGELLTEARFPVPGARTGGAFLEESRRGRGWGVVAVAATVALAEDGTIAEARVALGCVGPAPVRARGAEAALLGARPGPEALAAAGEAARADVVEPPSNVHGSAEYRRHLAGVLTTRALAVAAARAEGTR
jgi:carbon-monoxide dehydrogenase medium subunit